MHSNAASNKPLTKEEMMIGFESVDYYPRNKDKNLFAWKNPKLNLAKVITEVHDIPEEDFYLGFTITAKDKADFEWLDAENPLAVPEEIYGACIYDECRVAFDITQPINRFTNSMPILGSWISKDFKKMAFPEGGKDKGHMKLYSKNPYPLSDGNWRWYYIRRFWIDGMWSRKDATPVRKEMAKHARKEVFSGMDEDLHDMKEYEILTSSRGRKRLKPKDNDFVSGQAKKPKTKAMTKKALMESQEKQTNTLECLKVFHKFDPNVGLEDSCLVPEKMIEPEEISRNEDDDLRRRGQFDDFGRGVLPPMLGSGADEESDGEPFDVGTENLDDEIDLSKVPDEMLTGTTVSPVVVLSDVVANDVVDDHDKVYTDLNNGITGGASETPAPSTSPGNSPDFVISTVSVPATIASSNSTASTVSISSSDSRPTSKSPIHMIGSNFPQVSSISASKQVPVGDPGRGPDGSNFRTDHQGSGGSRVPSPDDAGNSLSRSSSYSRQTCSQTSDRPASIQDVYELLKTCATRITTVEARLEKFIARYEEDNYRNKDRSEFEKTNPALNPEHKFTFPLRTRRQLWTFAKALRGPGVLDKFLDFWEKKLVRDFASPAVHPEESDSQKGTKSVLLNKFLDTMIHPLLAGLQLTFGRNTSYKKKIRDENLQVPTPEETLDMENHRMVIEDMPDFSYFLTKTVEAAYQKIPRLGSMKKTIKEQIGSHIRNRRRKYRELTKSAYKEPDGLNATGTHIPDTEVESAAIKVYTSDTGPFSTVNENGVWTRRPDDKNMGLWFT